tara:strand:- start:1485 stop:1661 length:177 start_codon:yes stop_codon:yes gene_type:complete
VNAVTVTLATVVVLAMDAVEYTVEHAEVHPRITYPVYSVPIEIYTTQRTIRKLELTRV